MVYAMAKETGWPEDHILWGLPVWKANVYYLCALRAAGVWFESTVEVPVQPASAELLARVENFPSEISEPDDLYDFES